MILDIFSIYNFPSTAMRTAEKFLYWNWMLFRGSPPTFWTIYQLFSSIFKIDLKTKFTETIFLLFDQKVKSKKELENISMKIFLVRSALQQTNKYIHNLLAVIFVSRKLD